MLNLNEVDLAAHYWNYQYPDPGGWRNDIYYPRKVTAIKQRVTDFKFSTLVEQNPPIGDDTATIGTFTYHLGIHLRLQADPENYHVTLQVQNTMATDQSLTVIVNELEMATVVLNKNQADTIYFDVALTQPVFDLTFSCTDEPTNVGCLQLKGFQMEKYHLKAARFPRLLIASDSTAQTYTVAESPQTGWGAMLYTWLFPKGSAVITPDTDASYTLARVYQQGKYQIINKSIGGRSSRSFINEGKLEQLARQLRPNDYLLIQWGDNDATSYRPMRYVAPDQFVDYLKQYVDVARFRGAKPILITPPSQHKFDGDCGHIGFPAYRQAMIEYATSENIPCIDLGQLTADLLTKYGPKLSRSLYMQFPAGQYPGFPEGVQDQTHFNRYGAKVLAQLVARAFGQLQRDYEYGHNKSSSEAITELSAEVEHSVQVRLRWLPVEGADFYRVTRIGNGEQVEFTALGTVFVDSKPCQNPKYQVKGYQAEQLLAAAEIAVPMTFTSTADHSIAGINVYEIDRDTFKNQISFSLRFINHPNVAQYLVYVTNQRTRERRLLGRIRAVEVNQLHSYQVPKRGVWIVQVAGQDDVNHQRLLSKAIVVD